MYCYKCGGNLPDESVFCPVCGSKQPSESVALPPATPQAPSTPARRSAQTDMQPSPGTTTASAAPDAPGRVTQSKWFGLLTTAVAVMVGRYVGANILIPAVGVALAWGIGAQIAKGETKSFVPAVALQLGHLLWFAVGLVILGPAGLSSVFLDLFVMGLGLVWLCLKPGVGPVVLLTAWQAIATVTNLITLADLPLGSAEHKSVVLHIALRVMAVALMVTGLVETRRGTQLVDQQARA